MARTAGRPPVAARRPQAGFTGPSDSKEAQLGRLTNNLHNTGSKTGWVFIAFTLFFIILGIGLMGGIYESVNKDQRTESFNGFCYATWGVLTTAFCILIGFAFYYHNHTSYLHKQSIDNINAVYGTRFSKTTTQ